MLRRSAASSRVDSAAAVGSSCPGGRGFAMSPDGGWACGSPAHVGAASLAASTVPSGGEGSAAATCLSLCTDSCQVSVPGFLLAIPQLSRS
jgi:hypothetical protein